MAKSKYVTLTDLDQSLEGTKKEIKTAILESEKRVLAELQNMRGLQKATLSPKI